MIRRLVHRIRKNESGAEALEFAFVIPILLLLVFGIIEFGWIFHGYITLSGAAREGARAAVVMDGIDIDETEIENIIKSHARIFDESALVITTGGEVAFDQEREVTVEGPLDLLVSFPPFPETVNIKANATMRQEVSSIGGSSGNGGGTSTDNGDSGSPPELLSINNSSSSSELRLNFGGNVEIAETETSGANVVVSGHEVIISFDPDIGHNTTITVSVRSSNGNEENVYSFHYHHNHGWSID